MNRFLLLLVWLPLGSLSAAESVSVTAASEDDCTLYAGAFSLTADYNFLGAWNGSEQACGLRFPDVDIPQGAIIDSVWLTVRSESDAFDVYIRVLGHDTDSAWSFSDSSDFESRQTTSQYVDWNLTTDWGSAWLRTDTLAGAADLSPIVQEIISRPGWSGGNAIALLFRNHGTEGNARKSFRSYDRGSSYADTLHIIYHEEALTSRPDRRRVVLTR